MSLTAHLWELVRADNARLVKAMDDRRIADLETQFEEDTPCAPAS